MKKIKCYFFRSNVMQYFSKNLLEGSKMEIAESH
jgi:hypothetical protein